MDTQQPRLDPAQHHDAHRDHGAGRRLLERWPSVVGLLALLLNVTNGADAHVTQALDPAPTALVVEVFTAKGKPKTGAAVTAETTGDTVALQETTLPAGGPSGEYGSAARAWRRAPYRVVVDGNQRGSFEIDHFSDVTRLRVIDG